MNDRIYQPLAEVTNLYRDTSDDRYRIGMPLNANIAADTIGRFAHGEKANHVALIHEHSDLSTESYTFAELDELATHFAVFLTELGVQPGQPVAIHTAQSPQTAIAHMAIYKIGAIAMTLSHLYGPDACSPYHERFQSRGYRHKRGILGRPARTPGVCEVSEAPHRIW